MTKEQFSTSQTRRSLLIASVSAAVFPAGAIAKAATTVEPRVIANSRDAIDSEQMVRQDAIQFVMRYYRGQRTISMPVSFIQRSERLGYSKALQIAKSLEQTRFWSIRNQVAHIGNDLAWWQRFERMRENYFQSRLEVVYPTGKCWEANSNGFVVDVDDRIMHVVHRLEKLDGVLLVEEPRNEKRVVRFLLSKDGMPSPEDWHAFGYDDVMKLLSERQSSYSDMHVAVSRVAGCVSIYNVEHWLDEGKLKSHSTRNPWEIVDSSWRTVFEEVKRSFQEQGFFTVSTEQSEQRISGITRYWPVGIPKYRGARMADCLFGAQSLNPAT